MIIDYREKDLIEQIPTSTTKNLPVGDIWIGTNEEQLPQEGGILIERKTINDLIASILDGRYREQRTRLLAYAQETQTSLLYIIEGNINAISQYSKLESNTLKKWLNRLMLKYKIPVLHTQSVLDTANHCKLLEAQYSEDPNCFKFEAIAYENLVKVQKKANKDSPKAFFCAALQQCTGVSSTIALAIWEVTGSWKALLEISNTELESIKIGNRRLGPKLAERLKATIV
jgi:ERCC4-type nuclease